MSARAELTSVADVTQGHAIARAHLHQCVTGHPPRGNHSYHAAGSRARFLPPHSGPAGWKAIAPYGRS